jgi:hypothetical protein
VLIEMIFPSLAFASHISSPFSDITRTLVSK